jgi:hypothetical protein
MAATSFSRTAFLRRGLAGGGAIVVAGSVARVASALAAPDADLAALRLLVGTELLALDFQHRALSSKQLGPRATATITRMSADEQAHYRGLADLLAQAGQQAATPDDVDFTYPKTAFRSEASILKLAAELETLQLGAYIGASANIGTPQVRTAVAQISANEAQHAAALAALAGRPTIGRAFGPALDAAAVTSVLDTFES